MNSMKYVAIDIETTGLNPDRHQVIELAAVVETDWCTPVENLPTFHRYCNPGEIVGEACALWMNAQVLLQTQHAADLNANLIDLAEFLEQHLGSDSVTIAGKNFGAFDFQFLRRNKGWKFIKHKHRFIDIGSMLWAPVRDTCLPSLAECCARVGVQPREQHRATEDCCSVIECVRAWRAEGGAG